MDDHNNKGNEQESENLHGPPPRGGGRGSPYATGCVRRAALLGVEDTWQALCESAPTAAVVDCGAVRS
eukprot:gene17003-481_t